MEQYFSYKRQQRKLPYQYNNQHMVNGSTIWNTIFSTFVIIIINRYQLFAAYLQSYTWNKPCF